MDLTPASPPPHACVVARGVFSAPLVALLTTAVLVTPADAQVTRSYDANPFYLGPIPRCTLPRVVRFPVTDDFVIDSVELSLTLTTGDVRHLALRLAEQAGAPAVGIPIGPPATPVALNGTYTFSDQGASDFFQTVLAAPAAVPPGTYRVTDATGAPLSLDRAFEGKRSWSSGIVASLAEDCGATGPPASVTAATLRLSGRPLPSYFSAPTSALAIPDSPGGPQQPGPPADLTFVVPPGRGTVQSVSVDLAVAHGAIGEVVARLIAPNGASHVLFGYTGASTPGDGSATIASGSYVFDDRAIQSWWAAAATGSLPAGSYRTSELGGPGGTGAATSMDAAFAGLPAEGVWTLRVTDGGARAIGTAGQAFLTLATSIAPSAPMANDDHVATPPGTRIYVGAPGVLANDTHDASGGMTASVVTPPSGGVVTLDPAGRLDYTPNAGFTGRDQFTYQATNLVGSSAPATVTIDVAPPPTLPPGAPGTTSRRADPALLGPIPRSTLQFVGEMSPAQCLGGGLTVPLRIDDQLRVRNVKVSITASIASIGNLWMVLTPPRGPVRTIVSALPSGRPGSTASLAGTLTFSDDATDTLWAAISGPTVPPGTYRGHDFYGAAPFSEPDQPSAGVWTLQVYEYCNSGPQGSVQDLSIEIEGTRATEIDADPTSLGAIPDGGAGPRQPGAPREVHFTVPPGRGTVQTVAVDLAFAHPIIGQMVAELVAPDGTAHTLFGNLGSFGGGGSIGTVTDALTFSDRARERWGDGYLPRAVSTRTSGLQGPRIVYTPTVMDAAFTGRLAEGTWILRLTDGDAGGIGTVSAARLALVTSVSPTAPSSLRVSNVDANVVTLRWQPPAAGTPVGYIVEAGVAPGQTLVALPVGPSPVLTVTAPPGVFHARVRAIDAGVASPPSNEVRLVVQTPEAPSAPASLAALVDGSTVSLSWQNTFAGGAPTGLALDVSGAAAATIPLPLGETMTAAGVPSGTYGLTIRATNASGSSAASNPVTIAVPAACTGVPATPSAFLAYATGSVVQLLWDAPTGGTAVTGYAVTVGGGYTGTFPLATRSVSGTLPPGTYTFTVSGQNACGTSPPTATQTVVVP